MPPKTPEFWQHRTWRSALLLPLSWIYSSVYTLKTRFSKPYRSRLPVICIGGIVAGGSGKTPVLHALADLIQAQDIYNRPVILTRGYGGTLKGPTKVDVSVHSAADVGDESILHAARLPTIVARDRAAGARLAEAMGADVILMDDGMQNTTLAKTLSFAVIDAAYGTGNGWILPAGPLRETMNSALKKIDGVIITGGMLPLSLPKPVLQTRLSITSHHDKNRTYYGFAGLGRPEKFRQTLESNGFRLVGFRSFADHHKYSRKDIETLLSHAGVHRLITTEKDIVKIPTEFHDRIDVLKISLAFEDADILATQIQRSAP